MPLHPQPPKGDGAASKQVLDLPLESVARSAPEKDHERPSLQLAVRAQLAGVVIATDASHWLWPQWPLHKPSHASHAGF